MSNILARIFIKPLFYRECTRFSVQIHTTATAKLDMKWRQEKNLEENPNSFGKLTNYPDFSYNDGRPSPLTAGQKQRIIQQKRFTEKVIQSIGEINYALERSKNLEINKQKEKDDILARKLKPKGVKKLQSD